MTMALEEVPTGDLPGYLRSSSSPAQPSAGLEEVPSADLPIHAWSSPSTGAGQLMHTLLNAPDEALAPADTTEGDVALQAQRQKNFAANVALREQLKEQIQKAGGYDQAGADPRVSSLAFQLLNAAPGGALQYQAARDQAAQSAGAVSNFGRGAAQGLGEAGLGVVGLGAPEAANALSAKMASTYNPDLERFSGKAGEFAGSTAGQLAIAGVSSPVAAFTAMGAGNARREVAQLRANGQTISGDQEALYATTAGIIQGALGHVLGQAAGGKIPFQSILRDISPETLARIQGTDGAMLRPLLMRAMLNTGAGAGTNEVLMASQEIAKKLEGINPGDWKSVYNNIIAQSPGTLAGGGVLQGAAGLGGELSPGRFGRVENGEPVNPENAQGASAVPPPSSEVAQGGPSASPESQTPLKTPASGDQAANTPDYEKATPLGRIPDPNGTSILETGPSEHGGYPEEHPPFPDKLFADMTPAERSAEMDRQDELMQRADARAEGQPEPTVGKLPNETDLASGAESKRPRGIEGSLANHDGGTLIGAADYLTALKERGRLPKDKEGVGRALRTALPNNDVGTSMFLVKDFLADPEGTISALRERGEAAVEGTKKRAAEKATPEYAAKRAELLRLRDLEVAKAEKAAIPTTVATKMFGKTLIDPRDPAAIAKDHADVDARIAALEALAPQERGTSNEKASPDLKNEDSGAAPDLVPPKIVKTPDVQAFGEAMAKKYGVEFRGIADYTDGDPKEDASMNTMDFQIPGKGEKGGGFSVVAGDDVGAKLEAVLKKNPKIQRPKGVSDAGEVEGATAVGGERQGQSGAGRIGPKGMAGSEQGAEPAGTLDQGAVQRGESEGGKAAQHQEPAKLDEGVSGKAPWEMTKAEFYKKYEYQHSILREDKAGEVPQRDILEREGFRKGIGPNATRITQREPENIIEKRFGTAEGKRVVAIPREAIKDSPNGPKIVAGYKPLPSESALPIRNFEPVHEAMVREAISEGKPVPAEVLNDYPGLQEPRGLKKAPLGESSPAAEEAFSNTKKALEEVKARRAARKGKTTLGSGFGNLSDALEDAIHIGVGVVKDLAATGKHGFEHFVRTISDTIADTRLRNFMIRGERDAVTRKMVGGARAIYNAVREHPDITARGLENTMTPADQLPDALKVSALSQRSPEQIAAHAAERAAAASLPPKPPTEAQTLRAETIEPTETLKGTIRRTTGMTDEGPTIPIAEALKIKMKALQQAFGKEPTPEEAAFLEHGVPRSESTRKTIERMTGVTTAESKAQAQAMDRLRGRFEAQAEDIFDPGLKKDFIEDLRKARTPEQINQAVSDLRDASEATRAQSALGKATTESDEKLKATVERITGMVQPTENELEAMRLAGKYSAEERGVLDAGLRARFLSHLRDATTQKQIDRAVAQLARASEAKRSSEANSALRDTIGPVIRPKTEPTLASELDRDLLTKPIDPFEGGRIDPKKQMPQARDAMADLIGSLRQPAGSAEGAGKLADFIQSERDLGHSNDAGMSEQEIASLRALDGKPLAEMKPEETALVTQAIQHATFLGEQYNEANAHSRGAQVKSQRDDMIEGMRAYHPEEIPPGKRGQLAVGPRKNPVVNFLGNVLRDPFRFLKLNLGAGGETMWRRLADGQTKGFEAINEAKDTVENARKSLGVTDEDWRQMSQKSREVQLGYRKLSLSPREIMSFINGWGRESTRRDMQRAGIIPKRLEGNAAEATRISPEDAEKIIAAATPAERELARVMQEHLAKSQLTKDANAASVREVGYEKLTEPNYWPRSRDFLQSPRAVVESLKNFHDAMLKDMGFLKEAPGTPHAPVLLEDAGDVFTRHVSQVARFAHLNDATRDLQMILNDPAFSAEARNRLGRQFGKQAADIIQRLTGMEDHVEIPGAKLLANIRGRIATGELTFRLTSALNHFMGGALAVNKIPEAEQAAFLKNFAMKAIPDMPLIRDMESRNGYLRNRGTQSGRDLESPVDVQTPPKTAFGRALDKAGDVGTAHIRLSDRMDSAAIYKTFTDQYRNEHPGATPTEAKEWAAKQTEYAVRQTSTASTPFENSYFAQRVGRIPGLNLLTLFQSKTSAMRNTLDEAFQDWRVKQDPQSTRRLLTAGASVAAMVAAYAGVGAASTQVKRGFASRSHAQEKQTDVSEATELAAHVVDVVAPGIGGTAVRDIKAAVTGDSQSADIVTQTSMKAMTDLVAAVKEGKKGHVAAAMAKVADLLNGAGKFFGVSAEQPTQYLEGAAKAAGELRSRR